MIYGRLATGCGYTYPQIAAMTVFDVTRQFKYWNKKPPTHEMVAAYLGFGEKAEAEKPEYMTFEGLQAVMRSTGGRIEGLSPPQGRMT